MLILCSIVYLHLVTSIILFQYYFHRNVTKSTKQELIVESTNLRKNIYYYKIYFVYLNTFFASILPLGLLLFFNISTAIELIKMSQLETRTAGFFSTARSSINVHSSDCTTQINLTGDSVSRKGNINSCCTIL